ncbi:MAG TPA: hypothetical protein VJZ76_00460 [Thermoanaerobaculia bacterium]|nr:hypothetical protein [Thermoanaerobaculia bacterium]
MSLRGRLARFSVIAVVFLLAVASVKSAPPPPPPIAIQFGKQSVIVTASPGGQVAVFSVAREFVRPRLRVLGIVRRAVVLSDPAKSGIFTLDLGKPVPAAAIWIAVDLATGAHIEAGSPGYFIVQMPSTANGLKHDNVGQLRKLELAAPELDLLLVRPGEGAWQYYAAKSGQRDENADEMTKPIRIDVRSMQAVDGSTPPPANFKNGDVIALIDPEWMKYRVVEVGR